MLKTDDFHSVPHPVAGNDQVMNFVLQMVDFACKMMDFVFQMMNNDQRWIDNLNGLVIARNSRFGGEGGGFTVPTSGHNMS